MSINKKIFIIQQNREAAIASLNNYLDYIYNLHKNFFNEDDSLKPEFTHDEKLEELIISSKNNADKFENVRRKLIDEDFNLSLVEINYIALGFLFSLIRMKNQIKDLKKLSIELTDIVQILFEGTEVNPNEITQNQND